MCSRKVLRCRFQVLSCKLRRKELDGSQSRISRRAWEWCWVPQIGSSVCSQLNYNYSHPSKGRPHLEAGSNRARKEIEARASIRGNMVYTLGKSLMTLHTSHHVSVSLHSPSLNSLETLQAITSGKRLADTSCGSVGVWGGAEVLSRHGFAVVTANRAELLL